MEKLFTFAGVSNLNGVVAYRFANDAGRTKVLEKNGHTDVKLIALPEAMTKEDAIKHLNAQEIFAEATKVTSPARASTKPVQRKSVAQETAEADVVDDGFVEPKDEKVQVAMCLLASSNPKLSARELFFRVTGQRA
jgi:hypothetical protein